MDYQLFEARMQLAKVMAEQAAIDTYDQHQKSQYVDAINILKGLIRELEGNTDEE